MLQISRFTVENKTEGCVTDAARPRFSFALDSDKQDTCLARATLTLNGWKKETDLQTGISYEGEPLKPFTLYTATLTAEDRRGEQASAEVSFETGRMDTPWSAKWISDPTYSFTEKGVSPVPMVFRKKLALGGKIRRAVIQATAIGIYDLAVNGKRVSDRYFAPGFTSYPHNLMYQQYDVTELLTGEDTLEATVCGGWAVGSYVFTRANRLIHNRQAFLAEVRVTREDGSEEILGTDETWEVTEDGPVRMADLYDGETYDATVLPEDMKWRSAAEESLRIHPEITADCGAPVTVREILSPVDSSRVGDATIYDFGQNFAGVALLKIRGRQGQQITVRHAEILKPDGSLNTQFLRTAKATATYTCREGEQEYSPRFTYMGFRYMSVEGIAPEDIEVRAAVLSSDLRRTGFFRCSDPMVNRLQENILWSSRSNLMDIPTDCPQRDERMGWTGDIAVFGTTACFNFDMSRFLDKWLRDMRSEQFRGGGIPNTVPRQGYGFPTTMPDMAVDWWDDACAMVPWAEYMARGDEEMLRRNYPMIQKYIKAQLFWAGLFSFGRKRYIWNTPGVFHFGDWVAADAPKMSQWQARGKWTATASMKNMCSLAERIAGILGKKEDQEKYRELAEKISEAYCAEFTDGQGKLKEEFQTGYVLPLYLGMFPEGEIRQKAADHLAELVTKNGYRIGTGFPGTPYILFALADNGHAETAFRMLMNTDCPGWLYEVKAGGTTIWERWDGLDENGQCSIQDDGTGGMISYNHYASGAVGAFLYQRVAGLEALEPGYRRFRVRPLPGGGLTSASAEEETPYGRAACAWEIRGEEFLLSVTVPVSTRCEVMMPDGTTHSLGSGEYRFTGKMEAPKA